MHTVKEAIYQIPKSGRNFYCQGNDFQISTFGKFPGFLQANVAIMPAKYAQHYREFCNNNSGPCPLLYQSTPGEKEAPPLADKSNIQTDISTYQSYVEGERLHEPYASLLHHKDWVDMVSFYLGCSFSFDSKLLSSGIQLETTNVAMYLTNVKCIPSGPFDCNLVVSMRAIPSELVSKAVQLSINMDFAHGAPVHIGNPADIGIACEDSTNENNCKILKSDFGSDGVVANGCVPCFWACGVTGSAALCSAKLPIAFSHYPGSMFVADITSDEADVLYNSVKYPSPSAICTDEDKQRYVSVSTEVLEKLAAIERVVAGVDPGQRGIEQLRLPEDFPKLCLELSMRARSVGILVGFPVVSAKPAEENDGIAGAIYIARALQAIGVDVMVVVDTDAEDLINCFAMCKSKAFTHQNIPFLAVGKTVNGISDISHEDGEIEFSHLISIERPSPAEDGNCYTMTARNISEKVGGMAELFRLAYHHPNITTIGIGDGGNEVGMGKVKDKVKKYIKHGEKIAADVPAEFLLTCGVSNWGGLALAAGLFAVRQCPVHSRYQRRAIGFPHQYSMDDFIFNPNRDLALHTWLTELGFRDGVTGQNELTIDGLDYHAHHAPILKNLRQIIA